MTTKQKTTSHLLFYSSASESLTDSTIDYQFLGLSRMRNQNISTEIVGDLKNDSDRKDGAVKTKDLPYAVATLDGTIMLVQNEIILWYFYSYSLNVAN